MAELTWDQIGERFYETGVDRGVLYIPDSGGAFVDGVAWNGLTAVNETPSGAEATAQYADNIKYLNLRSAEEFSATVEAFTYPDEFAQFDGQATPHAGVKLGQQSRGTFGLCYRTRLGNDLENEDYGYRLHLVYGCTTSPSERSYNTINDSPEAINFSWEVDTTPVPVTGYKPTSIITIDSVDVDPTDLAELEDFLYGTSGTDPSLPTPDAVLAIFAGALVEATPTEPSFDDVDDVTVPSVAGVTYYHDGVALTSGSYTITEDALITARPDAGYKFPTPVDDEWLFVYGGA